VSPLFYGNPAAFSTRVDLFGVARIGAAFRLIFCYSPYNAKSCGICENRNSLGASRRDWWMITSTTGACMAARGLARGRLLRPKPPM
jgi:hypothetical protein